MPFKTNCLLIIGLILISGCSDSDNSISPTVATVNGYDISEEHFEESYITHLISTGVNDTPEQRYAHLDKLINDILLAGQASKYNLLDEKFEVYIKRAKRNALSDYQYYESFMDTLTPPTDDQIKTAFYNSKVKLFVSQLYFNDEKLANQYHSRLQNGESFTDLANELYNLAVYDSSAGQMGEISYFGVDDHFAEAAYALNVGEYSEPVKTRFGHYIIKVNNRVASPIVTDAEYQYKRKGFEEMTKTRILNIKGDEFIADFMSKRDIVMNPDNIREVFNVISGLSNKEPQRINGEFVLTEKKAFTYSDIDFINEKIDPDLPLVSYSLNGDTKYFTVSDYLFWLPNLPIAEARQRTIASVGRALRNEIFAQLGEENELISSEYVQEKIKLSEQIYKTWRVKNYLSEQAVDSIDKETLKLNFEGLNYGKKDKVTFTGWIILSKDFDEIKAIKESLESGSVKLSELDVDYHKDSDREDVAGLSSFINKIPMNTPTIIGNDGLYYLALISERKFEAVELEKVRDDIKQRISPLYNIAEEIKKLRSDAEIEIMEEKFQALMDYYDDPGLRSSY